MSLLFCLVLAALWPVSLADIVSGVPDAAPPGFEEWISPIVVPAKPVSGDGPWASAVARARDLVSQLTLDEKINITTGAGGNLPCVDGTGSLPRFNFSGFCLQDSPLGVRDTDYASAFPAGINVAATWDKQLMYDRGFAMGAEHRGKGVNMIFGPMTNLGRVAAGGRNWEGFGADPYLAGVATAQTVLGIQDNNVIACVKHFYGNEQEHYRGGGSSSEQIYSSNIDDRTAHELYIWPFAEGIRAGAASIMCSYNKVNQTQNCQNSKLLNGIIKEELDFQGFIVSDAAAARSGVDTALAGLDMNIPSFYYFGTGSYNGGASLPNEGNPDNTTYSWWGSNLITAVMNGSVPEARVDDMVTRAFAALFFTGQDLTRVPNFNYQTEDTYLNGMLVNQHVNVMGNHGQLIREIGAASIVMLKNTGVLPVDVTKYRRYGIFGSDAGPNPQGPNSCSDRGCDQGTLAMGWGSGSANYPYLIDPSMAITWYVYSNRPDTMIESVLDDYDYASINSVASQADICLAFVNADSGEEYITVDGNEGDRNNLTLWHSGEAVINASTSYCSNTIVVVHSVGPVLLEEWIDNPNVTAVLWAGLPGQETGNSLVDVLFGAVSPSGRLPYTLARQRGDYPADVMYESNMTTPQITYYERLMIDYRWFDAQGLVPRYEFGYGLSYTSFEYSTLAIYGQGVYERDEANNLDARWTTDTSMAPTATYNPYINQTFPGGPPSFSDTLYTITFRVTNTGSRDGYEVAQLYLGFPESAMEPPKVLREFNRVWIKAGERITVSMTLLRKDISIWDVISQSWIIPSGTFTVYIGKSSRDIQLTGTFEQ
ncbi:glycoside hydrolase family 3 protein [Calocera cornea HHB12733]|uniref:beta-glucosidase n=1 Tax=Calocera cornea HHB12733 TaxID=1353952 RepID=A0A165JBY4_9BASI|nr:glycoside hydrolase family 3 protein [Calocera cornea HHB12733]